MRNRLRDHLQTQVEREKNIEKICFSKSLNKISHIRQTEREITRQTQGKAESNGRLSNRYCMLEREKEKIYQRQ